MFPPILLHQVPTTVFLFVRFENEVVDRPKALLAKYDEAVIDEVGPFPLNFNLSI